MKVPGALSFRLCLEGPASASLVGDEMLAPCAAEAGVAIDAAARLAAATRGALEEILGEDEATLRVSARPGLLRAALDGGSRAALGRAAEAARTAGGADVEVRLRTDAGHRRLVLRCRGTAP